MKVVLDTNVLMSGIFFGGSPAKVLDAWRGGRFGLVVSAEIKNEYARVAEELTSEYGAFDAGRILQLIARTAETVCPEPLNDQVCSDPDDDIFIATAIAGKAGVIVSGDKALRRVSGFHRISILSPGDFMRVLGGE